MGRLRCLSPELAKTGAGESGRPALTWIEWDRTDELVYTEGQVLSKQIGAIKGIHDGLTAHTGCDMLVPGGQTETHWTKEAKWLSSV